MAKNIRFHYLYRDSGNYKIFGFKDFSNPNELTLQEIERRITQKLISGEFFYPNESGIEKFQIHSNCDDYSWYEFETLEFVEGNKPLKTIDEFIAGLSSKPDL